MNDLLSSSDNTFYQPLASRMRPQRLSEYRGQSHLLGEGEPLRAALLEGHLHSMILWGPPGTGKTTLARLMAISCHAQFLSLSAVLSGVKEIRHAIEQARLNKKQHKRASILFIDEVHRFNKNQQDAFLPHMEEGLIIFVGATTENPGFALNNALLSRARVYRLKPLESADLEALLDQAMQDAQKGLGRKELTMEPEAKKVIIHSADGDARRLLNILEIAADTVKGSKITVDEVIGIVAETTKRFDQSGDIFYDQLSAFHKSVRGSHPDAALYWCAQLIEGGADPQQVLRRLTAIASEDIGNADPRALTLVISAWQAFERLGNPEGLLALSQAVLYCALAPKSNAVYKAMHAAFEDVREDGSPEVPVHLRNTPALIREISYSKTYRYAHDEPHGYAAGENYFPDGMQTKVYYRPGDRGLEIKIKQKLQWLKQLDAGYALKK